MLKLAKTVPVLKNSFEYKIKALIYLVILFEILFRTRTLTKLGNSGKFSSFRLCLFCKRSKFHIPENAFKRGLPYQK